MHCQETPTCHPFLPRLRRHWLPHVSRALTAKTNTLLFLSDADRVTCVLSTTGSIWAQGPLCGASPTSLRIGKVSDGVIVDP